MLKHHQEQTKRFIAAQIRKGGPYLVEAKESEIGCAYVKVTMFKKGIFSLYVPYSLTNSQVKQDLQGVIGETIADRRDEIFKEANEAIRMSRRITGGSK